MFKTNTKYLWIYIICLFQSNYISQNFNFCGNFPLTSDPIQINAENKYSNYSFKFLSSINGQQLTLSFFYLLNNAYTSKINVLNIKMEQIENEIPNSNFQNILSLNIERDLITEKPTDGLRFGFPLNMNQRKNISLDKRIQEGVWYYIVVSFDLNQKKRFVSIESLGVKNDKKVIREDDFPDVSHSIGQKFSIGKFCLYS